MAKTSKDNKQQQIVDFNKLRKRRQRFTTAKRIAILSCVVALLLGAAFLNNLLVQENITTRLSDVVSGFGGSGYPVPLPGGLIKDVKSIGDNLAVLNDANLYVYNSGGKQVANFQQMNDSTVLLVSGNRIMTYDRNGRKYAIHSRSRTLEEQSLDYSIITAAINEHGDYAVVSSAKQFICEINVYNKRFEPIYLRSMVEDIVYAVSLSPKGNMMAAAWINGENGMLLSGVDIYRLSSDADPVRVELPDSLIWGMEFQEEDRIAILTDREYIVLGADGKQKYGYPFGGRKLSAVEYDGRQTLLLLEDKESRVKDMVLLDGELGEKAVYSTYDKVLDMQLASRRIYLLGEDRVISFDHAFEQQEEHTVQHVSRIHLCAGRLYYMTREEIRVLGQGEKYLSESAAEGFYEDDEEEELDYFNRRSAAARESEAETDAQAQQESETGSDEQDETEPVDPAGEQEVPA